MKPIEFINSSSKKLCPDKRDLPQWLNGRMAITCWKASLRERLSILFSGKVYVMQKVGDKLRQYDMPKAPEMSVGVGVDVSYGMPSINYFTPRVSEDGSYG